MRNKWYLIICLFLPFGLWGQIDYNIQLKSGTIRQSEMLAPEAVSSSFIQHNRLGDYFYLVLQFNEIPTDLEIKELSTQGISLIGYLPHYAYLARVPAELDFSVLNVRRVIPFLPEHKLSEALAAGDYSDIKHEGDIYYIKVVPFDEFSDFELEDMLRNYGVGFPSLTEQGVVVKLYKDQVLRLAKFPAIQYLEGYSDELRTEGLEGASLQRLNYLHRGPGTGLDGSGVSIAVADDGTVNHPDLQGRLTTYTNNNLGDHGDMTVGLFGGAGNINPNGVGAAPGVDVHLYSINGYPHITNAVQNYQKNRIVVTSTSYGEVCGGAYNSSTNTIDQQVYTQPVLFHSFSAGNSGRSSCANPYGAQPYNGSYFGNITGGMKAGKNVVAVGNVYFNDVLASSSSHGPTVDGRIKPDIVANGQGNFTIDGGTGYRSGSGTSAASPSLGGVAAGLYQAYRAKYGDQDPSSGLIKAVLLNTAEDLGRPGPDYEFGWGRVHAGRALETIQKAQFMEGSVRNGNIGTHSLQIPANVKKARVMVYWVDPAGSPNAAKALVNDIDLTLSTPGGNVVKPLVLSTSAHLDSLLKPAYQGVDRVNNMEQVVLNQPSAGNYTINVRGTLIPQGPQSYFIVYYFETETLALTYPKGGESLVAGEKTTLYWDAIGNTGTFTLEYSVNNPGNWQLLASNITSSHRYYEWNVPDGLFGKVWFRVRRSQEISTSASAAHVMKTPVFSINYGPNNQAVISWSPVTGADSYEVLALGSKYMEPIGQTSQTQYSFPAAAWQGNWYAVRARHSSGLEGQRAHAKYYLHRPCEAEVQLTLQLDQYPDETSWEIRTTTGEVLLSGGPYPSSDRNKKLVLNECLPAECLVFEIKDSYGDGICCNYINGFYELKDANGKLLISGGNFGNSETKTFCLNNTPSPLTIAVTETKDVTCNGGQDGLIRVEASGGSGFYTYRWQNGQTTPFLQNLNSGTYRVTVNDGNTEATASAIIAQPLALSMQLVKSDPDCNSGSTGSVSALVSGGTTSYNFLWSNGGTGASINNLDPGTYSVTVSDNNGCSESASATIVSGQSPDFSITEQNVSCFGKNDGQISITGQSSTGLFSYRWNTGATTSSISNLAAGNYSVTITHSSGCQFIRQIEITQPNALNLTLASQSPACNGSSNGAILSNVSGGKFPYNYRWSTGSQATNLSNLPTGSYTLTVTDAGSCSQTQTVFLAEPEALLITASVTDEQNGADGSIQLGISGGTAPYNYTWSNGLSSKDLYNLTGGTYTVTVTDSKACQKTASVSVEAANTGGGGGTGTGGGDPSVSCNQRGKSTKFEWIESVSLGNYTNESGDDGGYGDYRAEQIAVDPGALAIRLVPYFKGNPYNEYWRIWIDWNEDGDFLDAGEQVFQGISNAPIDAEINIPEGLTGTRVLRVAAKYASYPTACVDFSYGEVEDYTLEFGEDQTTVVVTEYCDAKGSSTHEWIQQIRIGEMLNASGNDDGYKDYTNLKVSAAPGTTLSVQLIPGHSANPFAEAWKIWADWNKNGIFEEPGELIFSKNPSFGLVSGNISIPSDAPAGSTRLRVAMSWNKLPPSCGNTGWGEVEDYTIEISATGNLQLPGSSITDITAMNSLQSAVDAANDGLIYKVFPNPVRNTLNIEWDPGKLHATEKLSWKIIDAQGRLILESGNEFNPGETTQVDVSQLPGGSYYIQLTDGYEVGVARFLILR